MAGVLEHQLVKVAERLILWGTVMGLLAGAATAYVRLKDTVPKAEATAAEVVVLARDVAVLKGVDTERWDYVKDRLERIERKLDRPRR